MVCLEDTRFILVWAECPYVEFVVLLVLLALKVHSRGYKWVREGQVPSLWWKERLGTESSVAARLCVRGLMLVVLI